METTHSVQRIIKDIKNDDTFIQVVGFVIDILEDDNIVIDDKTGKIRVDISTIKFSFKIKQLINVIGDLDLNIEGEKFIKARIIQDMDNLNFKYYRKLYELKKELE
ncbi:MAG: hypothetical protein ACTSR8_11305 [Promethearchaeota archaeon]